MSNPKGNGIVEIIDEKSNEKGFFCIKLVQFINQEAEPGTKEYATLWAQRFDEAKTGRCKYKNRCPIYKKTIEKSKQ